jgi:hypothetical protein
MALHRQRFLFGIFRLIEHDDIAARYAEALRHSGPGFRRADGFVFAAAPVKIIFDPGFACHRRMPSVSRGRLLLIRLELGAHSGFQV